MRVENSGESSRKVDVPFKYLFLFSCLCTLYQWQLARHRDPSYRDQPYGLNPRFMPIIKGILGVLKDKGGIEIILERGPKRLRKAFLSVEPENLSILRSTHDAFIAIMEQVDASVKKGMGKGKRKSGGDSEGMGI